MYIGSFIKKYVRPQWWNGVEWRKCQHTVMVRLVVSCIYRKSSQYWSLKARIDMLRRDHCWFFKCHHFNCRPLGHLPADWVAIFNLWKSLNIVLHWSKWILFNGCCVSDYFVVLSLSPRYLFSFFSSFFKTLSLPLSPEYCKRMKFLITAWLIL